MSAAPRTHVQLEPSWDSLKPRSPRWTRYPQYRIGTVFRMCSSVSCSLPALLTGFGMQPPRRDALLLTNHEQGDATLLNVVLSHDRAHTRSHVTAVSSKQVATNQIGVFVLRRQSRGIATLYHPSLVHRGAFPALHLLISDLYYCSTTLCSQMEHFAIGAYSQGGLLPERCAIILLRSQTSKSNMEDEILRCIDAPALAFDSCA